MAALGYCVVALRPTAETICAPLTSDLLLQLNSYCLGVRRAPDPKQADTTRRQLAEDMLKVERQILAVALGRALPVA